jgi:hypothetical protein
VEQKITTTDSLDGDEFGWAVDVSADGNTMAVGSGGGHFNGSAYEYLNAVYVYTRSSHVWSLQQKVQPTSLTGVNYLGWTAALSADGNTLATSDSESTVWIFTRSGSSWTQQQLITPGDFVTGDAFGYAVALSGDGNTAIVGAPDKRVSGSYDGAVYIYVRSGGVWSLQQEIAGPTTGNSFGWSVALSGDGNTAIVGSGATAPAYIYHRSAGVWTEQAHVDSTPDTMDGEFSLCVDISSDGNTAAVAMPDLNTGYVYVFTRSGSTWTLQQRIDGTPSYSGAFGLSLAISADGTALAIADGYELPSYATGGGAVQVYKVSGSVWSLEDIINRSYTGTLVEYFTGGHGDTTNVAISSDATLIAYGVRQNADPPDEFTHVDDEQGAVYTFVPIP